MTNKEIVDRLKQLHKRILETDLCSKIYEQEMGAIIEAITIVEDSLPIDINTELYEVLCSEDYKTGGMNYEILYGYVSSLRKDKDCKWHFRYTYYQYKNEYPLNPKKFDKSCKFKSLHEASLDKLYTGETYEGKSYFTDLKDAQKAVELLRSKQYE